MAFGSYRMEEKDMKQIVVVISMLSLLCSLLAGCGTDAPLPETTTTQAELTTESVELTTKQTPNCLLQTKLALVTDDLYPIQEYAQAARDAVEKFCKMYNLPYGEHPTVSSAINAGSNVIVLPYNFLFYEDSTIIEKNPDITFISINTFYPDFFSSTEEEATDALPNVATFYIDPSISAYLSGYAAVRNGYRRLGVCDSSWGTPHYGISFAHGAEAAALECGIEDEVCVYHISLSCGCPHDYSDTARALCEKEVECFFTANDSDPWFSDAREVLAEENVDYLHYNTENAALPFVFQLALESLTLDEANRYIGKCTKFPAMDSGYLGMTYHEEAPYGLATAQWVYPSCTQAELDALATELVHQGYTTEHIFWGEDEELEFSIHVEIATIQR